MKVAFVSTMNTAPWGGSELLWSEAALHLAQKGHTVVANICGWPKEASQVSVLKKSGIRVNQRTHMPSWIRSKVLRMVLEVGVRAVSLAGHRAWLAREQPDLICISNASYADDIRMMRFYSSVGKPYALIAQANGEHMWPYDQDARSIIDVYRNARRAFFVSEGNRTLLQAQLGVDLPNSEVVRNPFNVRRDADPAWPSEGVTRLACVGRLDPRSKGQDLLLQVLASEAWRSRSVSISFFGAGDMEEGLRRLADRLGVADRVEFSGHVSDVEGVWKTHHALVLPSRYEGLPLVVVEAMLCGRPVIVTNVAGNAELVTDGVSGFVAEAPTVHHLNIAMERAWEHRDSWKSIGKAAATSVRKLVPDRPGVDFAEKLLALAN